MIRDIELKVQSYAYTLLVEAMVDRQTAPGKHNFTGNLLNSIVVAVYKNGKPDTAYFASNHVKGAIHAKMTSPNHYHFEVDYDGAESDYDPEVETDKGYGAKDAKDFFEEYKPQNPGNYTIVLAYPTEYASYVEAERHTTGFARMYEFIQKTAKGYIGLADDKGGHTMQYSTIEVPF